MNTRSLYIPIIVTILGLFCVTSYASSEKIQLTTYFQNNSPPKYIESNQSYTGICIDIINELNARLDDITIINPEQVKVPVKRIMKYLELNKEIALFVGAAKTQARMDNIGSYSAALYAIKGTFAKRKTNDFVFRDRESLNGLTIGVLRGSSTVALMNSIVGVNVVQTNTIEQSLKMLAVDRVDLVYYHDLGLNWQITSLNLRDLVELVDEHQYLESGFQYILYNKNVLNEVIAKVDTVINAMHADGTIKKIIKKYQ